MRPCSARGARRVTRINRTGCRPCGSGWPSNVRDLSQLWALGDWQSGRANCLHLLSAYVLGAPGTWHMIPTTANTQPAAAAYHRATDGTLQAHGILVLTPPPPASPAYPSFTAPRWSSHSASQTHSQTDPNHARSSFIGFEEPIANDQPPLQQWSAAGRPEHRNPACRHIRMKGHVHNQDP
jgi:hypothetical protein